MNDQTAFSSSQPFLAFLREWINGLRPLSWKQLLPKPQQIAILSVDVIQGFCSQGALASPRVGQIVAPIVSLFDQAWSAGVRHILLFHDTHDPEAVEFGAYPPHCISGSDESEAVAEIKALPFYSQMRIYPKNAVGMLHTGLDAWLAEHPEVSTFIVVGDCTDICVYQLAMHLRVDANARQLARRVVVPMNCVDTYDRPVSVAQEQGGLPHDADLLHAVFLYHMALNGIEVCQKIE